MVSKSFIIVRYAETDPMGIAHHSNYAIWYEVARNELMKKMGMSNSELERQGVIAPLVEMENKFLQSAYNEDELVVQVSIDGIKPGKLEFEYEIYRKGEEELIHVGRTIHALLGKDMKPVNTKKEYPELYQKLLSAVEKPLLEEKKEKPEQQMETIYL